MIRTLTVLTALVVAGPGLCAERSAEDKGQAIVERAERRYAGYEDSSSTLRMILRDRQGRTSERELRIRTMEVADGGTRSLFLFDSPADVRGTILLTHTHRDKPDDQWLFLPAMQRVRRIAAQNRSGSFMGSEFSYEDIATQTIDKYTHKWLRDEEYDEQECHVIERRPLDERHSGYSRQVIWMDAEHLRTLKVDYYDRRGSLLKTLTVKDYRQYLDHFWRPHDMTMVNHQTGKSSQLLWSEYVFRTGLAESDFHQHNLTRIR